MENITKSSLFGNVNNSNENILPDILLLESNIPDNLTPLEKVRWLYINLGKLFSYDFRVANNPEVGYDKKIDFDKYIDRYQTCIQISEIINYLFNKIEGVESKTIPRSLNNARGRYGEDHLANEVIINDNGITYKLILDLTLDLFLIQSDCQTMHFGYQDDGTGQYDIISQFENEKIDIKLGFINNYTDYTDYQIKLVEKELARLDSSSFEPKDYINYRLSLISKLNKKFQGYHEGKQFTNILFSKLLNMDFHEFNLYYQDDENGMSLKTIYRISYQGVEKWVLYSNKIGFVYTDSEKIKDMLSNGWFTRSESLMDYIYSSKKGM